MAKPSWASRSTARCAAPEGFVRQVEIMREFATGRPDSIKEQLQKEFGLSDAYMQEVFG